MDRDGFPDRSRQPATDDSGRSETEAERDDRNLIELLQELRIAGLGVQVLFGFLLSLPFTNRFRTLDTSQRHLYVATLLLAALATALLTAPVAFHRWVFRRHEKSRLLKFSNCVALLGLGSVALAIAGAVLLVLTVVLSGIAVPLIAALTVGVFAALWFIVPLVDRIRDRGRPASSEPERVIQPRS